MESLPFVSIIIPNFNKESFVKESLQSIKNQTYANFEAIIVDDASTDNSAQVIEEFIKDDPRFILIKQETGRGGSAVRNLGFSHAKGEYVLFFDSDDLLTPTCLENRVKMFENSNVPALNFVVFPMGCFNNKIGDSSAKWFPRSGQNDLIEFLAHRMPWTVMQPLWRRTFLEKLKVGENAGPFDATYSRLQDVEMHTRALLAGAKYEIIGEMEPDCYYRIDLARTTMNREDQLSRQMNGFCTYIQKIGALVLSRSRQYKTALRLTFFEALVTLCYWQNRGDITKEFEQAETFKLIQSAESAHLLRCYHRFLVSLYCRFLRGRVKGMNWMMRKLISAF